jgi:hypothetical protein
MTAYLFTLMPHTPEGRRLLHLHSFEVEASCEVEARDAANAHMRGWRDMIAVAGRVPHDWRFARIEAFDRPVLIARNERRGAPDTDNPVILYLGSVEIGRIVTLKRQDEHGVARMRLDSKYGAGEFGGAPGDCVATAVEAVRVALSELAEAAARSA